MRLRAIFRVFLYILGGILLLVLIGILVLHTRPVREYALERVQRILRDRQINLEAAELEYRLLEMSAGLTNVVIRPVDKPDLPAFARIGQVRANLSLGDLIRGRYTFEGIVLRDPSIHYVIAEDGRTNLPDLPATEDDDPPEVFVERLRVTGGSLAVEDRRNAIALRLPAWQIDLDGDRLTSDYDIRFSTTQAGVLSLQERALPIAGVSASAVVRDEVVDVRQVRVATAESQFAFSGQVNLADAPGLQFDIEADLALQSLLEFAGVERNLLGILNVRATASGPFSELEVRANIQGEDLTIEQFERVALAAQAVYDLPSQRVRLPAFDIRSPALAVQGEGDLALTAAAGASRVTAQIQRVDLMRTSQALDLPIAIASVATGNVTARLQALDFDTARGEARLRLSATRQQPAQDILPVAGTMTVNIQGSRLAVDLQPVQVLAGVWRGQVTVGPGDRLAGLVRGAMADVGATVAEVERFLADDIPAPRLSGPAEVAARLGGTLGQPRVGAAFQSTALEIAGLENVTATAEVLYGPAGLDIRSARLRTPEGQEITASGAIDTRPRVTALDITARMVDMPLATVLALADLPPVPVSGVVTADARLTGPTTDLQIDATAVASELAAYGEPFGALTAQAQIRGDLITVPSFQLDKPPAGPEGGVLKGSARYNTDTREFAFEIAGENLAIRQMVLPDGTPVRGEFDLAAQGSGTVDDPNVTASVSAEGLAIRDDEIGDMTAEVAVANQLADIDVSMPAFNLAADAHIEVPAPHHAHFRVILAGTDVTALPVELPVQGTVTAAVVGSGSLERWREAEVVAFVENVDLNWRGLPIRNFEPIQFSYEAGTVTVEPATIIAAEVRIHAQGSLPLERTAPDGELLVQAYADLADLARMAPQPGQIVAGGLLTLDAVLRGSFEAIDPQANLTLHNAFLDVPQLERPIGEITLTARLEEGMAEIDRLWATWATARIRASGEFPLGLLPQDLPLEIPRQPGPARFSMEMEGLNLGDVPGAPERIGGTVSVRVDAEAPALDLNAVTARAEFTQLEVLVGAVELRQPEPSLISVSNSVANVEQFELRGPEAHIQVSGTAGLAEPTPLDLRVALETDAALLTAFVPEVIAAGSTRVQVAVTGTAGDPMINGFAEMDGAQFALRAPDVHIQDVAARLDFAADRLTITRFDALLNGGPFTASGGMNFGDGELTDVDIRLRAQDVYMDFPAGLQTVSEFDLTFQSRGPDLVLGGRATVIDGSYREDITLDRLVTTVVAGREIEITRDPDPMLARIRFNIDVTTRSPLIVDNNLARLAVMANLIVGGTYHSPGATGRIEIEEGGELYLTERTYLVERGVITLVSPDRFEPSLDILARTEAGGYEISLRIFGEPGDFETALTADPPLPQPDILAVLLTGRTLEEARGAEMAVAREQVLSYMTGRLGGAISREAQQALGFTRVRIEPNLIAAEADPGARLTIGQQLTRFLNLVYSVNLTDSTDQIWMAEYDVSRRFITRAIKQQDNTYRMEFRHDLRFGGVPPPRRVRPDARRVGNVSFTGNLYFADTRLADRLGIRPGDRFDFFRVRRGLDRLEDMYARAELLEARIRMRREERDGVVDLEFAIEPGPVVEFVYEGWAPPGGLRSRVREIWRQGVFDAQRAADAVDALRGALIERRYVEATVNHTTTEPAPGRRRVLFEIDPGLRYRRVELAFEGASGIPPDRLREVVERQNLETTVYTAPHRVTSFLGDYYREFGYLDAQVRDPRFELSPETRTGRVVLPVEEGPLYRIGEVRFSGNVHLPDERLRAAIPLRQGAVYTPEARRQAFLDLQDFYWENGFREVEVTFRTETDALAGMVDVVYEITENRQYIVQELNIAGTDHTSPSLVRGQTELRQGDVLNNELLSLTRRNLYGLGAYTLVDIGTAPLPVTNGLDQHQLPVRLDVRVQELQPYSMRYGGFFDTERGPGVIADFSTRNTLGAARVLGLRTRYDQNNREARLYFNQPLLRALPLRTDAVAFAHREFRPAFIADRFGISAQQETHFQDHWVLSYGYRFEQTRNYDRDPEPLLPVISLRVAPLRTSLTREVRDDFLDPTRGSLTSQALEYGSGFLGSQLRFLRYFGQYFRYIPLTRPREVPFAAGLERPRLVYAGAARVGLAGGLGGQTLVPSERFFAGGGTTIRGFEQDRVGPLDARGNPLGGDALFIMNHELRFPMWWIFDGVGFVDIGNIYRRARDFNPFDVRSSAGFGLRLRTPYILLRVDWGFKLDRRPGETASRIFFSIGQAF